MNKRFSRFLSVCLVLVGMFSSVSALALPADDAEIPVDADILTGIEQLQGTDGPLVNGYQLYIKTDATVYSEAGGGMRIGAVQKGDLVDDEPDGNGDYFGYAADGTLWRHIKIKVGLFSGISGWVPNSVVSSYSIST